MSGLSAFQISPGEVFTEADLGKPVYASCVLECWIDMYGTWTLQRSLLVGHEPAPGPLTVYPNLPCSVPLGTLDSILPNGLSVLVLDLQEGPATPALAK